ncbi:DUF3305 domain-containing protein [Ramlibacter sp. AW1]|uniref:DUF3305 domain-containing protein n=1 Tax=Ramlibacter aurantiacus TaxID=2801330 RepID=A0A936ZT38_9BURK|nr:DUF3305 domain-containing protein [Ramlibacter aurantiacus]MBL0420119.1 DUF3305 domain-containing protein [Ramlibacter aurantiacus]
MSTQRPGLDVAVLMRREALVGNRWQPWRWVLDSVVANESAFGSEPRRLRQDDTGELWLHPGLRVELFRDEAEGYYLNVTTPAPCWFVMWRMEETPTVADEPIARPVILTLSYNEAGRWLDAQETVENVPAPPEVVEWMREFAQAHYQPEPRRRQRPQSFQPLQDRFGNPASISTGDKRRKGGDGDA